MTASIRKYSVMYFLLKGITLERTINCPNFRRTLNMPLAALRRTSVWPQALCLDKRNNNPPIEKLAFELGDRAPIRLRDVAERTHSGRKRFRGVLNR